MKLATKFHELDIDDELLPGQGGAEDTGASLVVVRALWQRAGEGVVLASCR